MATASGLKKSYSVINEMLDIALQDSNDGNNAGIDLGGEESSKLDDSEWGIRN